MIGDQTEKVLYFFKQEEFAEPPLERLGIEVSFDPPAVANPNRDRLDFCGSRAKRIPASFLGRSLSKIVASPASPPRLSDPD